MIRPKLIEVSIPVDAINAACSREKSIRHGHPSTLHLYWARRPLAAGRAVIFAQMVDDPSGWPECFPDAESQARERAQLSSIIERMVPWKATTDEDTLEEARLEIWRSWQRTCDWELAQKLGGPEAYAQVVESWFERLGRVPSRESMPPDERVFGLTVEDAATIARKVTGRCDVCGFETSALTLFLVGPMLCTSGEPCKFTRIPIAAAPPAGPREEG